LVLKKWFLIYFYADTYDVKKDKIAHQLYLQMMATGLGLRSRQKVVKIHTVRYNIKNSLRKVNLKITQER